MQQSTRSLRRPRLRSLLSVAVAALIGVAAVAVPAQAAPTRTAAQAVPAIAHAVGPVTKSTPYGTMTYGFRPATVGTNVVRPDSASGCSQNTCITIIGSSNYVSEWYTQGIAEGAMCTWADFIANAVTVLSADVVCGDGAGVFYWYWYPARTFASPTVACNRWAGIPGYPCEVIRK